MTNKPFSFFPNQVWAYGTLRAAGFLVHQLQVCLIKPEENVETHRRDDIFKCFSSCVLVCHNFAVTVWVCFVCLQTQMPCMHDPWLLQCLLNLSCDLLRPQSPLCCWKPINMRAVYFYWTCAEQKLPRNNILQGFKEKAWLVFAQLTYHKHFCKRN